MENQDRTTNREAEQAMLGGLLIDSGYMPDILRIVESRDLTGYKERIVFDAMEAMYYENIAIDVLTISDYINKPDNEWGGTSFLTSLISANPTSLHTEYYAKLVREAAIRRRLAQTGAKIVGIANKDGISAEDAVAKSEEALMGVSADIDGDDASFSELSAQFVGRMKAPDAVETFKNDRIFTGWSAWDGTMLGIEMKRMVVSAGLPTTGKTVCALSLVRNIAERYGSDVEILYYAPEQDATELTGILIANGTGVDDGVVLGTNAFTRPLPPIRIKAMMMSKSMRDQHIKLAAFQNSASHSKANGHDKASLKLHYLTKEPEEEELHSVEKAIEAISGTKITFIDPSGWNIFKVVADIRRRRARIARDVFVFVVFDGAHLIPGAGEGNRVQELSTITRELRAVARKYIGLGALWVNTQLNRQVWKYFKEGEKNEQKDRIYTMNLLRDSGSWEQDADVIAFIDRQGVWKQHSNLFDSMMFQIVKNRQTGDEYTLWMFMNTTTKRLFNREEPPSK